MKKFYGWPEDAKFLVPEGVREHFQDGIGKRGRDLRAQWAKIFAEYSREISGVGRSLASHAAPRAARRLGQESAHVSRGCQRVWPRARVPERCSTRWRRTFPG